MKNNRMKITEKDYVKAMKKASRDLEIEMHGKQVSMRGRKIHRSGKEYDRKSYKKFGLMSVIVFSVFFAVGCSDKVTPYVPKRDKSFYAHVDNVTIEYSELRSQYVMNVEKIEGCGRITLLMGIRKDLFESSIKSLLYNNYKFPLFREEYFIYRGKTSCLISKTRYELYYLHYYEMDGKIYVKYPYNEFVACVRYDTLSKLLEKIAD